MLLEKMAISISYFIELICTIAIFITHNNISLICTLQFFFSPQFIFTQHELTSEVGTQR